MEMALRAGALALGAIAAAMLAGCNTASAPTPVVAAPSVGAEQLVGKWGLAAYHRDSDRDRTIKEAKAQCSKPVTIAKGPNGGVMTYLADNPQLQELVLKAGPDGATYLGPPGAAATADDRQVLDVDPNSFTTIWVDPDNASRYGTMVYERCGKRASA
jgi:hypothetical protein